MRAIPTVTLIPRNDDVQWIRGIDNVGLLKLSEITRYIAEGFKPEAASILMSFYKVGHGLKDAQLYIQGDAFFSADL